MMTPRSAGRGRAGDGEDCSCLSVGLQARGVRWAIIAVSGLVGFLVGIAHWFVAKA
jgi:hypothetical protein